MIYWSLNKHSDSIYPDLILCLFFALKGQSWCLFLFPYVQKMLISHSSLSLVYEDALTRIKWSYSVISLTQAFGKILKNKPERIWSSVILSVHSLSWGVFISPSPDCLSGHHQVQASAGPLTIFLKWQLFSLFLHYVFSSWFPFFITRFPCITSKSFSFVTWLSRSSGSCNILTFFLSVSTILIYFIYIKCLQWFLSIG